MVFGTEILGLWFATDGVYPDAVFSPSWNILLVLLSWLFAFVSAYCGLVIAALVAAENSRRSRYLWLAFGGIAMGGGVWAMHFIGMLAYDLPVKVSYDIGLTFLSWCIAVVSMTIAVRVFALPEPRFTTMIMASFALAAGVGGMHYTGMSGITGEFSMLHNPFLFWLSLAIAFVLAIIAYSTKALLTRQRRNKRSQMWKPLTAAIVATTIAAMHYVAMTAVIFYQGILCRATGPVLEADVLAVLLITFVTMLIGLTVMAGIARNAMIQSDILRAILENSIDAFLVIDERGLIRSANPAIEGISGWKVDELVGFHMSVLLPHDVQHQHAIYMREVNAGKRDDFMGRKRVVHLRNRQSERVPVHVGVTRLPSSGDIELYTAQIHQLQTDDLMPVIR